MALSQVRVLREFSFFALWKYTFLSVLIASVPFLLLQHAIIDASFWAINMVAGLVGYDISNPASITTGIIAGSFIFTAVMPFLGHFLLPLMALIQVLFLSSYIREYSRVFTPERISVNSSVVHDIGIVIKWTLVKWILFVVLHPLYHIPLVGLALSMTISTLWLLMIYVEIVLKACDAKEQRRAFLKAKGAQIFWTAIIGIFIAYLLIGLVGVVSTAIQPARVPLTVIVIAIMMSSSLLWGSEIFEVFLSYKQGYVHDLPSKDV